MILSWLKTYALQACIIGLASVSLFAGLQTWRLSSAHDKIDEQRQLIVDVKAANMANEATIEALRKANADWSAKCKAEPAKWTGVIKELIRENEYMADQLKKAPAVREVIYREVNDKCHAQPVPADIADRLQQRPD